MAKQHKTTINSLVLGSRNYTIEWVTQDELQEILENAGYDDNEFSSGASLHKEMRVVLCDSLKKHPQRAFETLWHERTHIIEDMCGRAAEDDGGWTEQIVDSTANLNASMDVQSGIVDLNDLVIGKWDFREQKTVP